MGELQRISSRGWTECVVAASGPSLTPAVADVLERSRVRIIAVNDAYRRLPFAQVLYSGDTDWWELHDGARGFLGEKWAPHQPRINDNRAIAETYGLNLVAGPRAIDAPGFSLDPARIHYGNCSGFQAINLAILFGATTIYLVGHDMRVVDGQRHFFGDHPRWQMNQAKYEQFIPAFNAAANLLPPHISIVNCTPKSALRCFPYVDLEEALSATAVR